MSDSIDPLIYQIKVLNLLTKKYISIPELQEQMEYEGIAKSKRTLERTLEKLADHFDDIERRTDSKPHQYRWKEYASGLKLLNMTPQQSVALMLAEAQLKNLLPPNIMETMRPFFEHAHYQMKFAARDRLEHQWLTKKVAVAPATQPLEPPQIDETIFKEVTTALYENRLLNAVYQAQWNDQPSRYQVMPLALVQQNVSHYLVVKRIKDGRVIGEPFFLALHRFLAAEASTFYFDYPTDFKLKSFIEKENRFGYGECRPIRLTFSISWNSGYHLTETPLSPDQVILEEDENHYRFQASVIKTDILERWLRGFGDEVWDLEMEYLDE
ncbi:hypothetical protein A4G20_08395 [Pasteurellaceae bacterium RH1A]|nr:hypothetical protein A4G20_08395 [Pasteurellaceae bacterium RH1A]